MMKRISFVDVLYFVFMGAVAVSVWAFFQADRQHQQTRPQHLGPRHQVVHRDRHVLEVAGIARRVGGDHVQFRTPGLRLAV